MTLEHLITIYGLPAVFLGAAIEGETMVVLGGVFSHRHLMNFWSAAAAASAGSFVANQAVFFLGRHARHYSAIEKVSRSHAFQKVTAALERHPVGSIFALRFAYGLRTISPLGFGMSKLSGSTFTVMNIVAAIIWGTIFTGIGFLFGQGIVRLFGELPLHSHVVVASLVLGAVVLVLATVTIRKPGT